MSADGWVGWTLVATGALTTIAMLAALAVATIITIAKKWVTK